MNGSFKKRKKWNDVLKGRIAGLHLVGFAYRSG
jgi:hypothetical protein